MHDITLNGDTVLLCKPCIRILESFPDLFFSVEFSDLVVLRRDDPILAQWLAHDSEQEQASQ